MFLLLDALPEIKILKSVLIKLRPLEGSSFTKFLISVCVHNYPTLLDSIMCL